MAGFSLHFLLKLHVKLLHQCALLLDGLSVFLSKMWNLAHADSKLAFRLLVDIYVIWELLSEIPTSLYGLAD